MLPDSDLGVSENRGSYYSTLNSRILIIMTPNMVPLIFGNSHLGFWVFKLRLHRLRILKATRPSQLYQCPSPK